MKRFHGKAATLALLLAFGRVPCPGTSLLPAPDISLKPSTDPPGSEGRIWRNFYVEYGRSGDGASSFTNYSSAGKLSGGISSLQWFEVAAAPNTAEPNTLVLSGAALVAIALLRIKRPRR
jgi:hypothetical protein